jgi:hypothetical protein
MAFMGTLEYHAVVCSVRSRASCVWRKSQKVHHRFTWPRFFEWQPSNLPVHLKHPNHLPKVPSIAHLREYHRNLSSDHEISSA